MAYNPKNKKEYSLLDDVDGKNVKELRWMVPKILRKLASNQINLNEEGFKFLDNKFSQIIIDVAYENAIKYFWDLRSYDALIREIQHGVTIVNEQEYNKILALRNEKRGKFNAYKIANDGFLEVRNFKSFQKVIETSQKMASYKDFYY